MFSRNFPTHQRHHTPRSALIVGVCMLAGCASSSNAIERLNDGSYRLECRGTLASCLLQAENPCAAYGYEVLSGRQETRVFGPEQFQSKYVSSEAIVMCRNAEGWFDSNPQPARAAEASPAPQSPAAACVPGASQSCTGPGGCKGGQTCAPNGRAFLVCDCGEAAAPAQEAQPAPLPQPGLLPESSSPVAAPSAPPSQPGVPAPTSSQPLPSSAAPAPAGTGATPPN